MTSERFGESEPLAIKHAKWLAKETVELGKSALVAVIALPTLYGLLNLVSPELVGNPTNPVVWGAVIGSDYIRRRRLRRGVD